MGIEEMALLPTQAEFVAAKERFVAFIVALLPTAISGAILAVQKGWRAAMSEASVQQRSMIYWTINIIIWLFFIGNFIFIIVQGINNHFLH